MKPSLKILMLEDSPGDAEIIQRLVKKGRKDCEFTVAADRETFLIALDEFQPDLILSDNSLPQFDATEALEITRKHSLSLPFILVTGTVSEEFAANVTRMGADDYILKDRLTRLPAAINTALARRNSEAAINYSEEIRRLIMMSALDAIICMDTAGLIMTWNPQAEKMFGWQEEEVKGRPLSKIIIPEQFRARHEKGLETYLQTGVGPFLNKLVEITALERRGKEFPIEMSIVPIRQSGDEFFCAFIRDITERKRAEQEILQMNERLRGLSIHLQNIREEESTRIAREIHDQLGQQLTIMKMDVSWVRKRMDGADPAISEKINTLTAMLDETVKMVRKIAADLRPSLLDDMGLGPAIDFHLEEFGKRCGIKTHATGTRTELPLSVAVKTGLFRVVQESLTNVARHASATSVTVSITQKDNAAILTVEDDGVGFDKKEILGKKSLGLLGMRERVAMMGGRYEMISAPGQGAKLIVSVPVELP